MLMNEGMIEPLPILLGNAPGEQGDTQYNSPGTSPSIMGKGEIIP
jgi:hypothetical protein